MVGDVKCETKHQAPGPKSRRTRIKGSPLSPPLSSSLDGRERVEREVRERERKAGRGERGEKWGERQTLGEERGERREGREESEESGEIGARQYHSEVR